MKKIVYLVICLTLFLVISGCATPMMVGLHKNSQGYIPSANPNKGLIYIYREKEDFGCLRGIYVTADGKRIGGLNSGSYFVYEADPGDVAISVENWLSDNPTRKIHVEAGKKYYLKGSLKLGILDASPHIEIVNDAEGEASIGSLTYATLKYLEKQ